MASSAVIEVLGSIVFSFTRGITEHCNPEEPEFTPESFGYNPLDSTGLEWYFHPVDELIYQEYSEKEPTTLDYLASSRLEITVRNASSPESEDGSGEHQQDEDTAMHWKRFRPSALKTVCKSMFIGALISLLTTSFLGTIYLLLSYLGFETVMICSNLKSTPFPIRVQWVRTISEQIACVFYYAWPFVNLLFLFRPYQLKGAKTKLAVAGDVMFCLDLAYRVSLQAVGKPYYMGSHMYRVPLNTFFVVNTLLQLYLTLKHFCARSTAKMTSSFCKMAIPTCLPFIAGLTITDYIYPKFNEQNKEGKLIIAILAPLIGVALKVISRICVQRLWNITHPGYSYVLLVPLYFAAAVTFRILQADFDKNEYIALIGIIHGAAEVIERSTMVLIDHISHQIWKRQSAPWGSFRTPRRERLMADIVIMSMLFESTGIVAANGYLYLYQYIYVENNSPFHLLKQFAFTTAISPMIEWFFTSASLAIETRHQNIPVMAVWRKKWKRHILVAIANVVPLALWTSSTMLVIVRGRFDVSGNESCKMSFS